MTSSGWTDVPLTTYPMRYVVNRTRLRYRIDLALPWNNMLPRPNDLQFAGYFKLHNNDIHYSKECIHHEVLSGVDEGRARTWWQVTLEEAPDGITEASISPDGHLPGNHRSVNLQGIATESPHHGIYIIDGKKYLIK